MSAAHPQACWFGSYLTSSNENRAVDELSCSREMSLDQATLSFFSPTSRRARDSLLWLPVSGRGVRTRPPVGSPTYHVVCKQLPSLCWANAGIEPTVPIACALKWHLPCMRISYH